MMRRGSFLVGLSAIGAVLGVVALAAAEKPVTVAAEQEGLVLDGGFSPKALSKSTPTPVALHLSGRVGSVGDAPPPALRELTIETDKSGAINLARLPTCGSLGSRDVRRDGREIRRDCESAIIGSGRAKFEIAFPGAAPLLVDGHLTVFNGIAGPRAATLYVLIDLTGALPGVSIAKVKVTKIHAGRFGTKAVVSIPKVATGSGSVVSFNATIFRKFLDKGETKSILTLTCADGKILARTHGVFEDGTESDAHFVRPCNPA
jgi:hypothetical protein